MAGAERTPRRARLRRRATKAKLRLWSGRGRRGGPSEGAPRPRARDILNEARPSFISKKKPSFVKHLASLSSYNASSPQARSLTSRHHKRNVRWPSSCRSSLSSLNLCGACAPHHHSFPLDTRVSTVEQLAAGTGSAVLCPPHSHHVPFHFASIRLIGLIEMREPHLLLNGYRPSFSST